MTGPEGWCAAHAPQIRSAARRLLRRWPVPAAVGAEDVEQEIRVAVLLDWSAYDPGRGMTRDAFVWILACRRASAWLHAQRGARGKRARLKPSQFPVLDDVEAESQRLSPEEQAVLIAEVRHLLGMVRAERQARCTEIFRRVGYDVTMAGLLAHHAQAAFRPGGADGNGEDSRREHGEGARRVRARGGEAARAG